MRFSPYSLLFVNLQLEPDSMDLMVVMFNAIPSLIRLQNKKTLGAFINYFAYKWNLIILFVHLIHFFFFFSGPNALSLQDCQHTPFGSAVCQTDRLAGVFCYNGQPTRNVHPNRKLLFCLKNNFTFLHLSSIC